MPDPSPTEAAPRFGLAPAPGGLSLVQDVVNTASADGGSGDLLADLPSARAWLAEALGRWAAHTGRPAPTLRLDADDLPALRALREELRAALSQDGPPARLPSTSVALHLDGGQVTYAPTGSGADAVAGLALAELLLAVQTDARSRLKVCANHACGAAFYDASRNSSRVWHDVRTCGNAANLRASRARRAARGSS